jgi:hypothetical protein
VIKAGAETAWDITLQAAHPGRESIFGSGGRNVQLPLFVICTSNQRGNKPGDLSGRFLAQVPNWETISNDDQPKSVGGDLCPWCDGNRHPIVSFPVAGTAAPPPPADTSSQGQPKPEAKSGDNKDAAIQEKKSLENDRLFFLLPNYLTVENGKQIPPLTTGQKLKLVALGALDPVEFPYVGVLAAIDQAENTDPSFRQGLKGYAKRYGAAYAGTTIENFTVGGVFPSLLHQDPRYYQLGKGGFWRRAGHAALQIFITRSDSGKRQFNCSELAGSALAAALSNTCHPPHDRTALNSANIWVTQLWGDAVSYELKEFWPDIRRKLHKKQQTQP